MAIIFSNSQFSFQADGELLEYKENDITINKLTENVQVFNDSLYLETDEAYNYKEISKLYLNGNTKMISNMDTLTCDSMIYWMGKDSLFAFGNVTLNQKDRKLNTDSLYFWKTIGYRGSSFIAKGNVDIIDEDKNIRANSINYDDIKQKMVLADDANILSNNRKLFGENVTIDFIDSLITFINVTGNAMAHNTIKTKINEDEIFYQELTDIMKGNNIDVTFKDNNIETIILDRMASTMYHVVDSSLLIGINSVDGELINLTFNNDELEKINVQGDARGSFIPETNNSQIDSIIAYKSDEINYFLDSQESYLSDGGEIKYQNMILEANYIHVNWNDNILNAVKKSDKLPTVTTYGGDPMQGDSLKYNLLDRHGTIYMGKTEVDDAYYHGEEIYRDDPNLYHVVSSKYTSCDLDHPHYSFYSNKMKMIPGDRIIAQPLILKIFDFPVLGVPFAILPNKGGSRHSGWIMPSFGSDNKNGTSMNGLGYYWAPNDYMDSKLLINFADRIGFWFQNRINYKLRYKLSGYLDVKFVRQLIDSRRIEQITGNSTTQQYKIDFAHDYTISPSQSLNIKFNYVSSYDFHENTSSDPLANISAQSSRSSLIYTKSWQEAGNSINFGLSDITDLKKQKTISSAPSDSGIVIFPTVRSNYPGFTFYNSTSNLFGDGEKWYNKFKWSSSSRYNGLYKKGVYADSDSTWADTTDYKNGINNKIQLAYPQKIFNWLNITSRVDMSEDWVFKYAYYPDKSFNNFIMKNGFRRRLSATFSTGLTTKIYGVFPVNIRGLEAIRHTITPSISMSYIPNITKPIMGLDLNKFLTNSGHFKFDANDKLLDPFLGSAVSPTSQREKLIYKFNIQNLFQAKYMLEQEKNEFKDIENTQPIFEKFSILDWNIKTQYDAFADSINWSPITSRIKSQIPIVGSKLDVDFTHDIYKINDSGQRVNEFMNVFYGVPIPSLTKLHIRTSFSLSGNRLVTRSTKSDSLVSVKKKLGDDYFGNIDAKKLWSANFGLTYKKEKKLNNLTQTINWVEKFQLNTTATLNFSKKWKLSYRVGFDLIEQTMGLQAFTFTRNLHCWEFSFNWIPGRSYFLHIYVKKPELRDIKLESRSKNNKTNFF